MEKLHELPFGQKLSVPETLDAIGRFTDSLDNEVLAKITQLNGFDGNCILNPLDDSRPWADKKFNLKGEKDGKEEFEVTVILNKETGKIKQVVEHDSIEDIRSGLGLEQPVPC